MAILPRIEYLLLSLTLGMGSATVLATPVIYTIDPDHTHPLFETDHYNGLSVWRGVFKKTRGTVTLDREARTGAVDIEVDMTSVEFGHDKLNAMAVSSVAPPILEAVKYPVAHYAGTLTHFKRGIPTAVVGDLTMHGVTKPVTLRIDSFKCVANLPQQTKEVCGADASARFNRADFGITVGQKYGFKMDVNLRIQIEATRAE